jgi:phosphoglycolate phosphatase
MTNRAVIFDLDGTLVDTAPDLARATNHVLALEGRRPVDVEEVRMMVGQGARRLIARGFERTGTPVGAEHLDRLFEAFIDYYSANIAVESRLFPGALEVLERCRGEGIALGICTNKLEGLSRLLIKELGLEGFFGSIVGQDTVKAAKPDPRPYREALRQLGMTNGRSVLVGDSETDVLTARAAGVPIIGMSFGYTERPVSDFRPDHLAETYDVLWPAIVAALDS